VGALENGTYLVPDGDKLNANISKINSHWVEGNKKDYEGFGCPNNQATGGIRRHVLCRVAIKDTGPSRNKPSLKLKD